MLALLGGVPGLILTQWTADLLPGFLSPADANGLDLSLDWRVLVFTFGLTILTGVLFGLAPALQGTRLNLVSSLKDDAKSYSPRLRRLGVRDILVISQLALSLVLLIGAALFVRSLQFALKSDLVLLRNSSSASLETRGTGLNKQQGSALYQQTGPSQVSAGCKQCDIDQRNPDRRWTTTRSNA